jgi:hypothetical protein
MAVKLSIKTIIYWQTSRCEERCLPSRCSKLVRTISLVLLKLSNRLVLDNCFWLLFFQLRQKSLKAKTPPASVQTWQAQPPLFQGISYILGRVRSRHLGDPWQEQRFGGFVEQTMQKVRSKTQSNR